MRSKNSKNKKGAHSAQHKKTARSFSKRSRVREADKKRSASRITKKGGRSASSAKAPQKAPIIPEVGMHIDGVLYRISEGRREHWRVIPNSKRVGFELRPRLPFDALEGELCECVITKDPDIEGVCECRITRVFGAADSVGANYEQILNANGIEIPFSQDVLSEAEDVSRERLSTDGRADLRDEIIFTIDGADAKDLDDAVSLTRCDGGYRLTVAIADVSHYVREGGECDREALKRTTSVYFTDKVVPMLPTALSNGACSLNAGEDKYALSAIISLDREGRLLSCEVKKSVIRSAVRGVYSEVNDILERGRDSEYFKKYECVYEMLNDMHELYRKRAKIAERRGYIELETVESVILLGDDGMPVDIKKRERGESERIIEQFMLLANEAVAIYMSTAGLPCVYRIHEDPDEEKRSAFAQLCSNYKIDAGALLRGCDVRTYAEILAEAQERGVSDIISESMLRSFMKAKYSEVRSRHFGLALDYYAHFTSPIRRYPDLAVHRILSSYLGGMDKDKVARRYSSFAHEAAQRSSEGELRALNAERAIDDLYKCLYMKKHEGEELDARIVSVQSFGFFCALDNTCEGLVSVSSLSGYYVYSEKTGTLSTRSKIFAPGDKVRVRVKFSDVVRRRIDLEYLYTIDERGSALLSGK